jgi:hypothetical protein
MICRACEKSVLAVFANGMCLACNNVPAVKLPAPQKPEAVKRFEPAKPARQPKITALSDTDKKPLTKPSRNGSGPTIDQANRCACGELCQWYGALGGYSKKCERCNETNAARQRIRRELAN